MAAALAATVWAAAVPAAGAAEWVHFDSGTTPPSKLRARLAKQRGIELKPVPPTRLSGRLTRPAGAGPHPAVVLLHGCEGMAPYQARWAERIAGWGYLALQVDSYGPRRIENTCGDYHRMSDTGQELDAFGALAYLSGRADVIADRIALLGWSSGASALLLVLDERQIQTLFPRNFRAAVAFYPHCFAANGPFVGPVQVLIGGADDWTPARRCRRMAEVNAPRAHPVALTVYPGAHHFFDDPGRGPPAYHPRIDNREKSPARGATFGHDAAAAADARARVRAFLARRLAD